MLQSFVSIRRGPHRCHLSAAKESLETIKYWNSRDYYTNKSLLLSQHRKHEHQVLSTQSRMLIDNHMQSAYNDGRNHVNQREYTEMTEHPHSPRNRIYYIGDSLSAQKCISQENV